MDPELWAALAVAAVAIGGVITFGVQVWKLRMARYELERQQLEISKLKQEAKTRDQRIQIPTLDEIKEYASVNARLDACPRSSPASVLFRWVVGLGWLFMFVYALASLVQWLLR